MASKLKMTVEAETAKARAELQKINASIDKMKQSQEKANKTFDNFLKGGKFLIVAKMATDAIQKIVKVSKELIDIYKVQEQAEMKLRNAIRASGREADISAEYLIKLAGEYQNLTTYGDEALISAQALMLSYKNIGQDVFPRALKAAMDMSSALDKDLTDSVKKVGEAVENPVKNFGALKEAGIDIDEQKVRLIKTLVAENKQWQAQELILKEIEGRYGGLSEAIAKTTTGKLSQLSNTYGDIKEQFGKAVLDDIDGWVDIGQRLAEGFLTQLKVENAKETLDNADPNDVRPLRNVDAETLEAMIKDADAKLKSFEAAHGQVTRVNQVSRKEVDSITAALNELAAREGESLQVYWEKRQAQLRQLALEQRTLNPSSPEEERRSLNASGLNPTAKQTTTDALGNVIPIATEATQTVEELLQAMKELYGGDWLKADELTKENEQILQDYEKLKKVLGSYNGEDLLNFAGFKSGTLNKLYGEEANKLVLDLQSRFKENQAEIAKLTGKSTEWLDVIEYVEKNQVLINYSLEDRIGMLETEIARNKSIMEDAEIITLFSNEERTNLLLITEEREAQLELLKKEQSGLKAAQDYLEENNSLLQEIPEYKLKAIDEQIKYNEELMNTVGLTEEEKEQYQDIIDLLKKRKKEAQGGGFGSQTIAVQMKMNMEKPEGWDEFFSSLESEMASLEREFGQSIKSITDMFNSLESAIIDSLRNALTEAENEVKEKTEIFEEKEKDEAEVRDEKMTALQEQYDADAISYEEYMAQKALIDDAYNDNIQSALDAKTTAEEEATRLTDEIGRKEFEANKRNSIATALINGAMATVRAFSDLGPIGGAIAAAALVGMTAAQVATISGQSYVPALAEGGVATKPTLAMIGDGDEPEVVLPLSKAEDYGFGGSNKEPSQIIVKVENNTIYGIDDFGEKAYKAIKSAQKIGRVPKNAF
ncbi:MAG: hypothetical protein ACOWWR_07805 [Eubacteriales bacterium]